MAGWSISGIYVAALMVIAGHALGWFQPLRDFISVDRLRSIRIHQEG